MKKLTWNQRIARFYSYVRKTRSCWLWEGDKNEKGYGEFWDGRKKARAHRFAYQLDHGPIPARMWVIHSCDVRDCVNSKHLRLGTVTDNNRDTAARGRQALQVSMNGPNGRVLTRSSVLQIRRLLFHSGKLSYQQIAERFGVSKDTIERIKRGVIWKVLPASAK